MNYKHRHERNLQAASTRRVVTRQYTPDSSAPHIRMSKRHKCRAPGQLRVKTPARSHPAHAAAGTRHGGTGAPASVALSARHIVTVVAMVWPVNKPLFACLIVLIAFSSISSEWKLVWSDEFDHAGLPDPARWNYEIGFVRNGEAQYYTDARLRNARVADGCLVLEARREQFKNPAFNSTAIPSDWQHSRSFADYTSASLTSRDSWTYGRIEVRAKLPSGRGVWPAIWMLGTNITALGWPDCGEIDIMEMVGFEPDMIYGHIHTRESITTKRIKDGAGLKVSGASDEFHLYAVEWDAHKIDFYVDDRKYYSYHKLKNGNASWPFDKPQYIILNLAIGGAWGGAKGIDDSIFPQRFYIDYVRIYQKQP